MLVVMSKVSPDFNPRSPWGERPDSPDIYGKGQEFQSTLPVGGATIKKSFLRQMPRYFNPRSPWGERQSCSDCAKLVTSISIHAPRGGSDDSVVYQIAVTGISIHAPRGGSDKPFFQIFSIVGISIHAPRGGSDARWFSYKIYSFYFNPRSPWGERRGRDTASHNSRIFQSTLPVGGATQDIYHVNGILRFQSTLPVGGATTGYLAGSTAAKDFNPRSPWGERPFVIGRLTARL